MSDYRILDAPAEDSELARWEEEGHRHEPLHSNYLTYISPQEEYRLTVELDDPVHGYLVRLHDLEDEEQRIGQTVVTDRDLALQVAGEMAAAADELAAVTDDPTLGPETVHREDVSPDVGGQALPPEGWDEEDQEEWEEALREAFEGADIPRSKGYLTTKEIDGREYYYLQWREGDKVKSQYIAPVNPA